MPAVANPPDPGYLGPMRRPAVLVALAVLVLIAAAAPSPASARTSPNCRAGTTLAVIAGKPACLRARARCRTKLDREYKTYGYRCRKPKRGRGRKGKRRPRLSLGAAKARRYGEPVALRPNGSISKATALQAFARTIAPLPGVKVRRGAIGRMRSGTAAWRWLESHRGRLSGRQRAAFDRYRNNLFPEVSASVADAATAQKYLDEAMEQISARVGGPVGEPLGWPAKLSFGTLPPTDKDASASAVTDTVGSGAAKHCKVVLLPGGQAEDGNALRSTLEHEAFHCFQDKWNPGGYEASTFWLWEGSANWASHLLDLERGYTDPSNVNWWKTWLAYPDATLFARSYGAIGFFAHMEASGLGFWGNIKSLIKAGNGSAAYAAATAGSVTGPRLLDTWAPSYHRVKFPGPGWDFTGPSIPPTKPSLPKSTLTNGSTVPVTSVERAAAIRRIALGSEVTKVSGDAHGRLTDVDGDQRQLTGGDYCTKPGGCVCPDGKPGPPDRLNASILVGVTGHDKVATVKFKGQSLKDWCKKAPPGGRLVVSGAFSGTATGVGACSVSGDDFSAIIETDTSPRRFVQMDTGNYGGPGGYPATGTGVSSQPVVWVTDGFGTAYSTEYQPKEGGSAPGGFTVSSETATQVRGTVDATMFDQGHTARAFASGTWVCDKV